jgi:hypothetical protein
VGESARLILLDAARRLDLERLVCPFLEMEEGGRYLCRLWGRHVDPEVHPCEFTQQPVKEKLLLLRLRCCVDRLVVGRKT